MKTFQKGIVLAAIFSLGMLPALSWARVTIDPNFSGTLILTQPNGEVTLFEAGDALPEIPAKSTLEVFDGAFTVHTEAGDQIQLGCFGGGQSMGGGSSATLSCGENSGVLKLDGKEILIAGVQAPAEEAPATAASDLTGVPAGQDAVPDSRSIQASPAA